MTDLRKIRRGIKYLEPHPVDEDGLQVEALEKVLDSLPPEECQKAEAAITEQLALAECGFSASEVEGMLTPESKSILADLEARAAALLPEIKRQQATLYRRKYAIPSAACTGDEDVSED